MKRYFIESAKCGVTKGGFGCGPIPGNVIATVQFNDGETTQWLTLAEVQGIPNFVLADKDIHEAMLKEDFDDDEYVDYMQDHFIGEFEGIEFGEDYATTFECIASDPENPAAPLIRYLITLTRCGMDEVEELIQLASGKYTDEIDIPQSDVEQEFLEEYEEDGDSMEDYDKESLYRMRLSLETDIATDSIFHEMDSEAFDAEKTKLEAIKERCEDEEDFETWKNGYLTSEYEKVKGEKFLVCRYLFAGIGQYEAILPAEQKESFICWIDRNGSAFYGGEREATEAEIKKYLALHADTGLSE